MKTALAFFLTFLGLLLSGCASTEIKSIRETEPVLDEPATSDATTVIATDKITIYDNKIEPSAIRISVGQTVTFQNNSSLAQKIASDPHPGHELLPDLYSPPIYSGEKYQYTFNKIGRWRFHLEDNPSIAAEVVVE